jgi:predicted branched-subunit amino acid permease
MPTFSRAAMLAGARAMAPLSVPALPFGLVFGLAVTEAGNVDNLAGFFSSILITAGASQLASVELLDEGAALATVVLTVAVINARHLMYSARLSSRFRGLPLWFRIVAPYALMDQVFAVADMLDADVDDQYRLSHYVGSALPLMAFWWAATGLGVLVGNLIPPSWQLDFSIPLLFGGLMILGLSSSPGVLAAVVGGTVAVLASDLPSGSGLLLGAALGVAAGGVADWAAERRGGAPADETAIAVPGPKRPGE